MAENSIIRRKISAAQALPDSGRPGADRALRLALARTARDHLKLSLDVGALALVPAALVEVLEKVPEKGLILVLEGPGDSLGLMVLSNELLTGLVEVMTMGQTSAEAPPLRRPTRTDAAMMVEFVDQSLTAMEGLLAEEADLSWAGGYRYASFLEDARPLGLLLDDVPYKLLTAEIKLAGLREGRIILALRAERALAQARARSADQERAAHLAFGQALAAQVRESQGQLDGVIDRLMLPISKVMTLEVGQVLALPRAALDRISVEGLDGRVLGQGRLGQQRGMRALRLTALGQAPGQPGSAAAGQGRAGALAAAQAPVSPAAPVLPSQEPAAEQPMPLAG